MNPRYNIALVPQDPAYSDLLTREANRLFGQTARDYLLGPQALPHATLCQFRAENNAQARTIFNRWAGKNVRLTLDVDMAYLRPDKLPAPDIIYAGLLVNRELELQRARYGLARHLMGTTAEPLTATGAAYWPHFTMAFIPPAAFPFRMEQPDPALFRKIDVRPVLGLSDEAGQLKRILAPSAR